MTLIVALDPPAGLGDPLAWSLDVARQVRSVVQGFKIGLPFVLSAGLSGVEQLSRVVDGGMLIADLKLADIGYVMSLSTSLLARAGVDSVIAHAFVGYEDALRELKETCSVLGLKLVLVVAMSHRGAGEVMWRVFDSLLDVAARVGPWGIVVPATNPGLVRKARERLGSSVKILSPGVGAQGAEPGEALCAGADYEIVGRSITLSSKPFEAAVKILEEQRERLKLCSLGRVGL